MANPIHIEWLLEGEEVWTGKGVEAWNGRRLHHDFVPDFENADFNQVFDTAPHPEWYGMVTVLSNLDLTKGKLRYAKFRLFDLSFSNLKDAELKGTRFVSCILRSARFRNADLEDVDLTGSDLFRTDFRGANLKNTTFPRGRLIEGADVRGTDLSKTKGLDKRYYHLMRGDADTILPSRLPFPDEWAVQEMDPDAEEAPPLPDPPIGHNVTGDTEGLHLSPTPTDLDEATLANLFEDLREAVEDLQDFGNLDNQAPMLAKGVERFLKRLPSTLDHLDQVRFGTGVQALSLQFKHERQVLEEVAPEKIGHLEAALLRANLIAENLPIWIAFRKDEAASEPVFAARQEDIEAILEHAADALESDPNHFDPSLFQRIREYLNDATLVGYLASKNLLVNIAHRTFVLTRDLAKDSVSETRKLAIKGIGGALLAHLAGPLLQLAGLLPIELAWLARWIEYLPKLL